MRTDSTRISEEAVKLTKSYIIKNYGKDYTVMEEKPIRIKVKKKLKMLMKVLDLHLY